MPKIFVIDDDPDICSLLKRFLSRYGFEVLESHSGKKALNILETFVPDLVMADFRLEDMDGKNLLIKIKEKYPKVPVIIITGYSDIKIAVEVMKLGAYDYVTKPLFPDEIAEARRFVAKYGFVPVNHTYIVRGDIYRHHPGLAVKLYSAFTAAKAEATKTLTQRIPAALVFGREYLAMTRDILGDDPFPYGVKANRKMLDTVIAFSHEQGLTPRKMKIEELFAEETLDT